MAHIVAAHSPPSHPCVFVFPSRQLSTRFREEDIKFSSLRQTEQDVLKADVLSHLYHSTDHTGDAAPDWDELTVTMQAYDGVTSVRLVRNGSSGSKTPDGVGKHDLVVRLCVNIGAIRRVLGKGSVGRGGTQSGCLAVMLFM